MIIVVRPAELLEDKLFVVFSIAAARRRHANWSSNYSPNCQQFKFISNASTHTHNDKRRKSIFKQRNYVTHMPFVSSYAIPSRPK
jgi:hypothetical protein